MLRPTAAVPFALAALIASASSARAEPATFTSSSLLDRPHTIAELELGGIVLPTAPISPANRGGNIPGLLGGGLFKKGDATLQTGIHLLFRTGRDFAFGAGAFFAPNPSSDNETKTSATGKSIERTHSRSYMYLGAEGRYYPLRYRWFEGWVGLTAGVIVIADRFETAGEDIPTILGRRENTQRTEGFAYGVQAGADYLLTDNWVLGFSLRASRWLLPNAGSDPLRDPACSSFGDCPTITGTVEAFEFGFKVGYRIPL